MRAVLDLETLGTTPGCVVLTIGLTLQPEPGGEVKNIAIAVERKASLAIGLTVCPNTLDWHGRKQKQWQRYLDLEDIASPYEIHKDWQSALDGLFADIGHFGNGQPISEIWANGSNFDFPILRHIAQKVGCPLPWGFEKERCFRTARKLFPHIPFTENSHDALADAINQHLWLEQAIPWHKTP